MTATGAIGLSSFEKVGSSFGVRLDQITTHRGRHGPPNRCRSALGALQHLRPMLDDSRDKRTARQWPRSGLTPIASHAGQVSVSTDPTNQHHPSLPRRPDRPTPGGKPTDNWISAKALWGWGGCCGTSSGDSKDNRDPGQAPDKHCQAKTGAGRGRPLPLV